MPRTPTTKKSSIPSPSCPPRQSTNDVQTPQAECSQRYSFQHLVFCNIFHNRERRRLSMPIKSASREQSGFSQSAIFGNHAPARIGPFTSVTSSHSTLSGFGGSFGLSISIHPVTRYSDVRTPVLISQRTPVTYATSVDAIRG